jgi:hypothetical protein
MLCAIICERSVMIQWLQAGRRVQERCHHVEIGVGAPDSSQVDA